MRIATNQHANLMLNHVQRAYGNWNKAQVQVATGMKYESYSENTAAAARVLSLKNAISDIARVDTNIGEAKSVLTMVETSLSSMNESLLRINELALQAANGTTPGEDVQSMKAEIDELIKQVASYANAKDNGMYLFGGTKFNEEPFGFNEETGMYEYNGSTDNLKYNISSGYSVDVLRNGENLTDVLNNLHELSQTLGEVANGNEGAKGKLSDLINKEQDGITTVSSMLTNVGASISSLNTQKTAIASQRIALETRRSNIEEVDQTEALTDVNLTRFAYEATLSMVSQMASTSILKYL